MGTLKILDSSGHTTLTEDNSTLAEREAAWAKAVVEEHKVPFDADTKEPITDKTKLPESSNVLVVAPIAGG